MTTPTALLPGLTVRPAVLDDAAAVRALLNEVDLLEIGRAGTSLAEVRADLKHPDVDPERDSWLVFEGERLVAYGLVWDDSGGERSDMDHHTLPGGPRPSCTCST